ncbi:hypothetical protein ACFPER_01735 [Agromyces aurantiacus]|uniref:Signal transduction histidine kinase dimerisation/phosphoacceptor domain-containing protein n=1 Tax=Agromyces aurantiacus TaxID=165814 RepID=A0ABV9R1K1_9MICO|nr:hypothetical protein [Agromyces aurantiacus]MBM7505806.1 hypothetical protein [Agromyces aurantiacus]
MDVIFGVLLALMIIVAVSLTTVFLVVRAIAKRIRRSPAIGGAVLRTRARVATGPRGKVLRLRVRLRETLESGRAAVALAASGTAPRGELSRLFRRIEHEGEALDLQLRLMESEPDAAVLAEELPAAGRRVDQVADLVHRLRASVGAGLGGVSDDALTALRAEVDREVVALHAGVGELRTLNAHDASGPGRITPRTAAPAPAPNRGNRP